jgi:hypothetical protein
MQIHFISSNEIGALNVGRHETIFLMPFTDPAQAKKSSALLAARAGAPGLLLCVYDQNLEGFISIANRVYEKTQSTWFGYTAQDAFAGRNWLDIALKVLDLKNGVLLGFNDGKWSGELAAFGLAQRAWASLNYGGPLFFPEYERHYADVELSLLAQACDRYVYDANSVMVEIDWEKETKATNINDKKKFQARKQQHFDYRDISNVLLHKFS